MSAAVHLLRVVSRKPANSIGRGPDFPPELPYVIGAIALVTLMLFVLASLR